MPKPHLLFGPYKTPRFKYGATVLCEVRGYVEIIGLSDGRIPWPLGKPKGGRGISYVVYKGLAKAIRKEANVAVQYWFGVAPCTVSKWRGALDVPRSNEGTHAVLSAQANSPGVRRGRKKAWAKARDPERRAKIAAARRGKKRPPHVVEAIRKARLGKPLSEETRRKMSQAHRKRGTYPPAAGKPWTAEEDQLVKTLPVAEVVRRTGHPLSAVYGRRRRLGVPDGRRRKQ